MALVTLNDVRKLAIKGRQRIQFPISTGQTCLISETGIARVPGLDGPPKFNLEEELKSAVEFTLEQVVGPKEKPAKPVRLSRHDFAAKAVAISGGGGGAHDDHDDE